MYFNTWLFVVLITPCVLTPVRFQAEVLGVLYPESHEALPPVVTTGRITTTALLNREEIESYVLTVVAMDTSGFPLNATATVAIEVSDRNDNKPQFTQANFSFDVTEETFNHGSTLIGEFLVCLYKDYSCVEA